MYLAKLPLLKTVTHTRHHLWSKNWTGCFNGGTRPGTISLWYEDITQTKLVRNPSSIAIETKM